MWNRWVAILDRREPATSLALCRIAVGLSVFGALAAVLFAGVVPLLWLPAAEGGYTNPGQPWLFRWLGVTSTSVYSVLGVTLFAAMLMILGCGGRLPIFVTLQGYMALSGLNGDAMGSYDLVITNALWLLVLSRCTATLALDCRRKTGHWRSAEPIPAWPRYVIVFQLVLIYWTTALHKLSLSWVPGGDFSALYYILQQPTWQRRDMSLLAYFYPLTQIATAITWLWELTAPLLLLALWYRATAERPGKLRALVNRVNYRRWWVVIGVVMHLSIFVLMEVGPFSWIMLSLYFCLYHPNEWRSLTPSPTPLEKPGN